MDTVYGILTGREAQPSPENRQTRAAATIAALTSRGITVPEELLTPLPRAGVGELAGLIELLVTLGGHEGLAEIADELRYEIDDLLPIVDAAELLKLATADNGQLHITENGRRFAAADISRPKEQFATLIIEQAPLVRRIVRRLRHSDNGDIRADTILADLRHVYTDEHAHTQLDTAIDWGRYAELFEYDADTDRLLLPTNADAATATARHA